MKESNQVARSAGAQCPGSGPSVPVEIERVTNAAKRMCMSYSQFYRVAKRDGIRIIKMSGKCSVVLKSEIDAWVASRVAAAMGGQHG